MRRMIGERPRQQAWVGTEGDKARTRWDQTPPPIGWCLGGEDEVGGSALKREGCQGSTRDDGRPDEVVAGGKGWRGWYCT